MGFAISTVRSRISTSEALAACCSAASASCRAESSRKALSEDSASTTHCSAAAARDAAASASASAVAARAEASDAADDASAYFVGRAAAMAVGSLSVRKMRLHLSRPVVLTDLSSCFLHSCLGPLAVSKPQLVQAWRDVRLRAR